MSNVALFKNNAVSSLAGAITNTSLTANLASGGGALFPSPGAGQYFTLTFNDAATGLLNEIVWVTNVTGDVITMTRGQEGTGAQNWSAGDIASALITAGDLQTFAQLPQVQAMGTNSAVDTGAANAYSVALTPALTGHIKGAPIFWQAGAANGNTGASTFNDGAGALPLVNPDGTALGTGTIVGNGYYISVNDGNGHFQLISASNEALSSQGISTTGDMKFRPTSETIPGWIQAFGLTIGNATSGANGLASATALALFTWHWTNFSNTQCPVVPSGRGASAAADFAANKTIQTLSWQGVTPVGIDTGAVVVTNYLAGVPVVSGNQYTPGSIFGSNTHSITLGEAPAGINSAGSNSISVSGANTITVYPQNNPSTSIVATAGTVGQNTSAPQGVVNVPTTSNNSWTGISTFQSTNTINASGSNSISVTSNNTGGAALSLVSRAMGVTWYLKL
jgi:hypothetical protein